MFNYEAWQDKMILKNSHPAMLGLILNFRHAIEDETFGGPEAWETAIEYITQDPTNPNLDMLMKICLGPVGPAYVRNILDVWFVLPTVKDYLADRQPRKYAVDQSSMIMMALLQDLKLRYDRGEDIRKRGDKVLDKLFKNFTTEHQIIAMRIIFKVYKLPLLEVKSFKDMIESYKPFLVR